MSDTSPDRALHAQIATLHQERDEARQQASIYYQENAATLARAENAAAALTVCPDVSAAIADMEFARRSHLAWADHLEAHQASGESCAECDAKPYKLTAAHEREWVAKYDRVLALLAALTVCQQQLAECYRLTGADPDGNTDAALAPYAVAEVKRMREELEQEIDRVERVAKMCGEAADRQAQKHQEAVAALTDQRPLVARLRAYVQHKGECGSIQPDLSSGCPLCAGPVSLNRDRNAVFCERHTTVEFFPITAFPLKPCTCGLAALVAELEPV